MKREGFGHPKMRLAARDLRQPLCTVYGIMESLWYATAVRFPRGDIGRLTDEEIGAEIEGLEMLAISGERLVEVLVTRRLIDRHPEHRLIVHDWSTHADSHVHAYLAKRLLLFADGTIPRTPHDLFNAATRERIRAQFDQITGKCPAQQENRQDGEDGVPDSSGTSPDQSRTFPGQVPAMPVPVPVQEKYMGGCAPPASDPELFGERPIASGPERPAPSARGPDPLEIEFETRVRPLYPKRHGDHRWRAALGGFRAARKRGEPLEAFVSGVRRYAAYCESLGWVGTERVKQAATFFGREECWRETWGTRQEQASSGTPAGTQELDECAMCGEVIRWRVGEPKPRHACPAREAAAVAARSGSA